MDPMHVTALVLAAHRRTAGRTGAPIMTDRDADGRRYAAPLRRRVRYTV